MAATLRPSVIMQPHVSNDGQQSRRRKVRSDKGKARTPYGARGPRGSSIETAKRVGPIVSSSLTHSYWLQSAALHQTEGVLSPNAGLPCAG